MEYVYSPIYPVARRGLLPTSHRSGWALYWAEARGAQLLTSEDDMTIEERLRPGDRVLVYHGMEFESFINGRPLNIRPGPGPGPGPGPETRAAERFALFTRLAKRLKKNLVSLDYEMPDYAGIIEKRAAYPSFETVRHLWSGLDLAGLRNSLGSASSIVYPDDVNYIVFGDSHALSLMAPGRRVVRMDGQTLYGALRHGLDKYVERFDLTGIREVTFYFGNVDIRHHLVRPSADLVEDLVREYFRQVGVIAKRFKKIRFYVQAPLPIESEDRKVPKTGWYKGSPFYGSRVERNAIRQRFLEVVDSQKISSSIDLVYPPLYFCNDDGELSYDVMEKPSSIHIRPSEYVHRQQGHPWTCYTPKEKTI